MKKLIFASLISVGIIAGSISIYSYAQGSNYSDQLLENVDCLSSGEGPTPCGGSKSETTGNCLSQNTVNCKDLTGCS